MAKKVLNPVQRGKWEATLKNIRVLKVQIRKLAQRVQALEQRLTWPADSATHRDPPV